MLLAVLGLGVLGLRALESSLFDNGSATPPPPTTAVQTVRLLIPEGYAIRDIVRRAATIGIPRRAYRAALRAAFQTMNENAKRIAELRWQEKGGEVVAAPAGEPLSQDFVLQPLVQPTVVPAKPWGFGGGGHDGDRFAAAEARAKDRAAPD